MKSFVYFLGGFCVKHEIDNKDQKEAENIEHTRLRNSAQKSTYMAKTQWLKLINNNEDHKQFSETKGRERISSCI